MALVFTEQNFQEEVLDANQAVLVDFYADWCGPCKMMAPVVDEIAEELNGVVKVGKLNVDNSPEIARKYGVMNIPTLLILKNGEVAEKIVGVVPKAELVEKLNMHK